MSSSVCLCLKPIELYRKKEEENIMKREMKILLKENTLGCENMKEGK